MQIKTVSTPMVMPQAKPRSNALQCYMSSGVDFAGIPNNPQKKGKFKQKLQDLKQKLTPSYETKQDLKKIGVGTGVATAGALLLPLVPVVGPVAGMVALWGGVWYGATGVINMLQRKTGG